jgi:RimJ/RimL family protein N-acetyltransferase
MPIIVAEHSGAAELSAFGRLDAGAVLLRPWQASDVPQLPLLIGDWRVARWLIRVPYPYVEADARFWLGHCASALAKGEALSWAITRPDSSQLLGGIDLRLETPGRAEIGYWMGLAYQRRGYVRLALEQVLTVVKSLGRTAEATVDPLNAASRSLLISCGFVANGERSLTAPDGRRIVHDFLERVP